MIDRTATEHLAALNRGDLTAEILTAAYLEAIRQRDPRVQAFLHVDEADALEQARAIDTKRRGGAALGPLAGLPIAIKDVLCTRGQPTTCGSKMLQNYRPPYDATVIARLRQADAILLGRTNMDEFAMGSSTENSAYQVTHNPWNCSAYPAVPAAGQPQRSRPAKLL